MRFSRQFAQALRKTVCLIAAFLMQSAALGAPCLPSTVNASQRTPLPAISSTPHNADYAEADSVSGNVGKTLTLQGNVVIARQGMLTHAEHATIDMQTNAVQFAGRVNAQRDDIALTAESAQVEDNKLRTGKSRYQLKSANHIIYGKARRLNEPEAKSYDLNTTALTTCAGDTPIWQIDAADLNLNQNTGLGRAKHMSLYLAGVPIFYFPYVKFPIDDRRRSGFLMPTMEYSESRGLKLGTPWYWNIAPNADAILTPTYYSKYGWMLESQWRYKHKGGDAILHSKVIDDIQRKENRYEWSLNHTWQISEHWRSRLSLQQASDDDFEEDFGSRLTATHTDYLRSFWQVDYQNKGWHAGMLYESYDIIDETLTENRHPYRRLPKLWLNKKWTLNDNWSVKMNNTLTRFEHESESKTQGTRLHQNLTLQGSYQAPYYFFKPSLSAFYTNYHLDAQDNFNLNPVVNASLDAGLYFERLGERTNQVLSPRLFYTYTPYRDQSGAPVFDSGAYSLSYNNLFRRSRYTGQDRIGDANQISAGLTWQLFDAASGRALVETGIGRRYSFIDNEVTVSSNETPINQGWSDVFSYAVFNPTSHWRLRLDSQYSLDDDARVKDVLSASYHQEHTHFGVSYRYNADKQEQVEVAFAFDIDDNWRLLHRSDYDIKASELVERMLGVEYDDCCFGVRVMATQSRIDDEHAAGQTILDEPVFHLQLVFKGLGQLGNEVSEELTTLIPGYRPKFE